MQDKYLEIRKDWAFSDVIRAWSRIPAGGGEVPAGWEVTRVPQPQDFDFHRSIPL